MDSLPHPHSDSSSRAITSIPPLLPDNSNPGTSSQLPVTLERRRAQRHPALGEQFNAPLRPHVWTAKRRWTKPELLKERRDFFDTRVSGHAEIWATLELAIGLMAGGDIATAQSALDAAGVTIPTGDLKNGVYDEAGNLYQIPDHIISDPQNLSLDHEVVATGETLDDVISDEDDELEKEKVGKGKGALISGDDIKVRARLSDRGGPDIIVAMGRDQITKVLVRRIQAEANVRSTHECLLRLTWIHSCNRV